MNYLKILKLFSALFLMSCINELRLENISTSFSNINDLVVAEGSVNPNLVEPVLSRNVRSLVYSCKYDLVVDDEVSSPADCSSITGLSFDESSGEISFNPGADAYDLGDSLGRYELKIIANFLGSAAEEIFVYSNDLAFHVPMS